MKKILITGLFLLIIITAIRAQETELDTVACDSPKGKLLIAIAKKAVQVYAPAFYRDHAKPRIDSLGPSPREGENNRIVYYVVFPRKKNETYFVNGFAASVSILADPYEAVDLLFGDRSVGINLTGPYAADSTQSRQKQPYYDQPPRRKFRVTETGRYVLEGDE